MGPKGTALEVGEPGAELDPLLTSPRVGLLVSGRGGTGIPDPSRSFFQTLVGTPKGRLLEGQRGLGVLW